MRSTNEIEYRFEYLTEETTKKWRIVVENEGVEKAINYII